MTNKSPLQIAEELAVHYRTQREADEKRENAEKLAQKKRRDEMREYYRELLSAFVGHHGFTQPGFARLCLNSKVVLEVGVYDKSDGYGQYVYSVNIFEPIVERKVAHNESELLDVVTHAVARVLSQMEKL
jgi:hypothetical protein